MWHWTLGTRWARSVAFVICFVESCLTATLREADATVMIPMRDGSELATDLYLPSPEARKLPCVLVRSPSGRKRECFTPVVELTKQGYLVAIQGTRSTTDPQGKTFPFAHDGWGVHQDGYDTVEWLAKSEWTNGRVGTMGQSSDGITQLLMAPSAPPSLRCQYIQVAVPSLYHYAIFVGGQLHKNQVEGWLACYAKDPTVLKAVVWQPHYNDFWRSFDSLALSSKVQAPAVLVGGWYDTFLQGTLDAFMARQEQGGEGARGKQKLVIGPWSHFYPMNTQLGEFEVPEAGRVPPVQISPKDWFDYYLKGMANGAGDVPAVTYYVMGPLDGSSSSGNVWKTSSQWPVAHSDVPLYFQAQGRLAPQPHGDELSALDYRHDPANPVPTIGGRNLFLESGAKDQRSLEGREDVLVFTTDALENDVEVTGRLKAKVFVTSDQHEMDVAVRLCDVYPDGRSILVADGLKHLRCANESDDKPIEVEVDLWSTSLVFAKGHRIRVSVSGSDYPAFDKSEVVPLEGKPSTAHHKLYLGAQAPSHILLPIVDSNSQWQIRVVACSLP